MDDLIAFLRARNADEVREIATLRELAAEDQAWLRGEDRHRPDEPDRPMIRLRAELDIINECARGLESESAVAYWLARQVLVYLALPHTDHPDYREEWRP